MDIINQTVSQNLQLDLNNTWDYLSFISKYLTNESINIFSYFGINVSVRWASYFVLTISLLAFYFAIKLTKPFIKGFIIMLAILLIIGLLVPFW